jgi:AAA15 family ATPase/GTPase
MCLISICISKYKNLQDFALIFDGNSYIDIFVGKNGTGKSNLFEALIEIFRHIVESDHEKASGEFNYHISLEDQLAARCGAAGWGVQEM